MKTAKKILALLLALATCLCMFTACGSNEEAATEDEAAASDTIVILSSGAFEGSLDPTKNSVLSNKHLEFQVFDCLLWYDEAGNLYPNLAKEWEYLEDGCTLRVYLEEGVKFHNGSEMTAEDVAASVEYTTREDSAVASNYGTTFECTVVDTYTVDLHPSNDQPLAALLTLLAHDAIMCKADIEAGTLDDTMNGTGPYKFVKYENETAYLEKFEDYWNPDRAAKVQYAEYKYVAEASTRMAALQSGEAQVIERVDIEQVDVLSADTNVVVDKVVAEEQRYIVFKTTQGPMGNENLRKAMAYAIDTDVICNDILKGYGEVADSYLPSVNPNYSSIPESERITYDMDKAKELLAEAGYPNGEGLETIKYISSTGLYPKSKEIAEYITQCWTDLGLDIELVVEETAAWEGHLYEEASCYVTDTGWMNMFGDANAYLGVHYGTTGRVNFSSYADVDAALAKETTETDDATRKAIIADELFPLLVNTCTNYPMYNSIVVFGRSANVSGVSYYPNSNIRFADISYN